MPKTIDRKIYFYRFLGFDNDIPMNTSEAFHEYYTLLNNDYNNLKERGLIMQAKDMAFFLDIYKVHKDSMECVFYKLRESDFPYLFNLRNGKKSEISNSENDTLMEQTHFIVYPNINLIVCEFNGNGARIEKLRYYLPKVLNKINLGFSIDVLIMPDVYSKLANAESINSFTFRVGHMGLRSLKKYMNLTLFDDLDNTFSETEPIQIEVTVSGSKKPLKFNNQKRFTKNIINMIKSLKKDETISQENLSKARFKAKEAIEDKLLPLDLLDEKLLNEVKVQKISPSSKYVDSEEMFRLIAESYNNQTTTALKLISNFGEVAASKLE